MVFKFARNAALLLFLLFLFVIGSPALKTASGMLLFFWGVCAAFNRKLRGY